MFATRRYAFLLVLLCMLLFYGALVVPLSFASTAPLPSAVSTDRFVPQDNNAPATVASAPALGLPISVTMAGNFQSELGCPGDWQPECVSTQLSYDADDDVWQGTWDIPAGEWEYKAALNGNWDENYGLNATPGGANIPLVLSDTTTVKFYYDDKTHWVTDNQYSVIATAAGSFQSEMGCPGDWSPDCLRSWLEDPDGDGVYSFVTTAIPVGNYEVKAALNESWDVNYGAGCAPGGANIPFSVAEDGTEIYFEYRADTHCLTVSVEGAPTGNISLLAAHWVLVDTIAWNVSCDEGDVFSLHYSATADLLLTPGGVTGGETITLTCDPAGLPASVQEKFPHSGNL